MVQIILIIVIVWIICIPLSMICVYMSEDEDDTEVDYSMLVLFPANLIIIVKYWWKAIIKAIKS